MKSIQIWFEDADFEKLQRAKGSTTWRKFLLDYGGQGSQGEAAASPAPSEPTPPVEKEVSAN